MRKLDLRLTGVPDAGKILTGLGWTVILARVLIRREASTDLDRIDEIHRQAFAAQAEPGAEPVEVGLVRALRDDPDAWIPALSLVAEIADEGVVGHVLCTAADVDGISVVGLGPVGVSPAHQGEGVGSALMHAVLGACDALDVPLVALLGHLDYYPRFGFVPAVAIGVEAPDPSWGGHFQARRLGAWTPAVRGRFSYAKAFRDL